MSDRLKASGQTFEQSKQNAAGAVLKFNEAKQRRYAFKAQLISIVTWKHPKPQQCLRYINDKSTIQYINDTSTIHQHCVFPCQVQPTAVVSPVSSEGACLLRAERGFYLLSPISLGLSCKTGAVLLDNFLSFPFISCHFWFGFRGDAIRCDPMRC